MAVQAKPWERVCVREVGAGLQVQVHEVAGKGLADVDPLGRARFETAEGKTYHLSSC